MLHFHEKGSFDPTAQMSLFVELQLIKYIRNNSKRTFLFISVISHSHTFSSDSHCSHLLRSGFANGGTRVPNVNYLSSSKSTLHNFQKRSPPRKILKLQSIWGSYLTGKLCWFSLYTQRFIRYHLILVYIVYLIKQCNQQDASPSYHMI